MGRTPVSLEVEWLPDTTHQRVEMELQGYERSKSKLGPGDSETRVELKERLEEIALKLKLNPPGILIQVDGRAPHAAGDEVKLSWSLSLQEHILSFSHPGYTSKSVKVTLKSIRTPLEVHLIPLIAEDR